MAGVFVGSTEIKGVYLGTTEVKKVYLGSELVWNSVPVPTPKRMTKSGSQTLGGSNSQNKIVGWVPGTNTVAGDIVNEELVINGTGTITVNISLTFNSSMTNSYVAIVKNNVQMAAGSPATITTATLTWTGAVTQGDSIAAWVLKGTTFSRSCTAGYVEYTV